jgi:hypothetical protein
MPDHRLQQHMPRRRTGITTSVTIGGERFYLTTNGCDGGSLAEVFIQWGKQGSTAAGLMDIYAVALSVCSTAFRFWNSSTRASIPGSPPMAAPTTPKSRVSDPSSTTSLAAWRSTGCPTKDAPGSVCSHSTSASTAVPCSKRPADSERASASAPDHGPRLCRQ